MISMMRTFFNLPIFRTHRGRQVVSLWASKIFEKSGISKLFGVNLVAAVVFTGLISPEADNLLNQRSLQNKADKTQIVAQINTETTFEKPLVNFKLSQFYSYWHQGIDMTTSEGSPVYAIDAGYVEATNSHLWGYGKHVIVNHGHDFKSLYAHLSSFETVAGRHIERGELIGRVGSTGWSTGDHLHFEVYYQGVAVNPLEVLPIKKEEIVYDGILWNKAATASPSASPTASN